MADEQTNNQQTDEEQAAQAQDHQGDAAADSAAPGHPGADQAEAEATADVDLAAELANVKDQLLRNMAEVENVKRRAQRDVENAHKFAVEKLIDNLFPVLDSLEKAIETAHATEGAAAIAEGVDLSMKLFVDTLKKSGVEQIDPLGEPFDPQLHEAMTMVPNPDAEPNSVMDVMQKGYVLNGRLVRAAKVIVVKGE